MANSLNKVTLVGNIGRDPEVRSFQNGSKVCNLSLATSERWKDKETNENKSEDILSNAPEKLENYFVVPKVVG